MNRLHIIGFAALVIVMSVSQAQGSNWTDTISNLSPVGWWRLNETSGTTASDASVSGNDGLYLGSPTLNQAPAFDAPSNRSVQFHRVSDLAGDHVDIGDVLDLGAGSFTLLAWFNKTSADTSGMKIVNKGLTNAGTPVNAGYQLRIRNGVIETGAGDAAALVLTPALQNHLSMSGISSRVFWIVLLMSFVFTLTHLLDLLTQRAQFLAVSEVWTPTFRSRLGP